ncbi:MAG: hypothetical protein N2595_09395 [bacterium]|nr:hypothetical protein [bacterium]
MKQPSLICFVILAVSAIMPAHALTVVEARALPPNTLVEVGPVTVTTTNDLTASGYAFTAQDDTGGIQFYWSSAQLPQASSFIQNNGIVPGSSITVRGSNAWFSGLYQLVNLAFVTNHGFAGVPAPTPIAWANLQRIPHYTNFLNLYIIVSNARFRTSGTFQNAVNYTITNLAENLGAFVRIQDAADPLVGTPIPNGNVTIVGIYAHHASVGPQIFPLQIIPDIVPDNPNINLVTNFGFGIVHPGQTRTLSFRIQNNAAPSNLTVSSFAPVSGQTNHFVLDLPPLPLVLLPMSSAYINVTYLGGAASNVHQALYQILCNDPSDPTNHITFWGGVASNTHLAVWINEVDYDTPGSAVNELNEFVELCGPAGLNLNGWKLEFWYSPAPGTFSNYATHVIGSTSTNTVLPNDTNGFGYYVLASYDTQPDFPNIDEFANFSEFRNDTPNAIRLVNPAGEPVHFLECETYYANAYPCGWPDDVTSWRDSNDPEKSLSLICTGFDRTALVWGVIGFTPGTPNIPTTNLPPPGVAAQLREDTYVQLYLSNRYQGGIAYLNVEADSYGQYAARIWLKFNTSNVVAHYNSQFGPGLWDVDSATLRLSEYTISWSQAGLMKVYYQPNNSWWEGPTSPPAGDVTGSELCWNNEHLYTNDAVLVGTYKSKGGNSENRCSLNVSVPPLATACYHGAVISFRIYAEDGAATYRSQNYTNDVTALPMLFIYAVPEPLAGVILLMLGALARWRHKL